jgi:hypothetical protein
MTPLVITPELKNQALRIIEHAQTNIVDIVGMYERDELKPGVGYEIPGDQEKHTLMVPTNFKVVYSLEDQGKTDEDDPTGQKRLGICRHLSMSIGEKGRVPNFIAVDMMAELFQFDNPIYQCIIWLEEFGEHTQTAINIIEPLEGWPNEIRDQVELTSREMITPQVVEAINARREHDRKTLRKENGGG